MKADGEKIFEALWTAVNEYEEIKAQVFTVTKSHDELRTTLDNMVGGMQALGHQDIQFLFTDDCCKDRAYFAQCIPSLSNSVNPTSTSRFSALHSLTLPTNLSDMVIIVNRESLLDEIMMMFFGAIEVRRDIVVSFDLEWTFTYDGRPPGKVSVLQIAYGENIYIIQLQQIATNDRFPVLLKQFLEHDQVQKVGVNILADVRKMQTDYGITVNNVMDLRQIAKSRGLASTVNMSLEALCGIVLKLSLTKDSNARTSNWERQQLSDAQIQYAAMDVWCGLKIYEHCITRELINSIPTMEQLNPGVRVKVLAKYGLNEQSVAEGIIATDIPERYTRYSTTGTHTFVQIQRVLASNARLPIRIDLNGIVIATFGDLAPFQAIIPIHKKYLRLFIDENVEIQQSTAQQTDGDATEPDLIQETYLTCINELEILENGTISTEMSPQTFIGPAINQPDSILYSRVLQDIFHVMQRFDLNQSHGLHKDFYRALRDAIFIRDETDVQNLKRHFSQNSKYC